MGKRELYNIIKKRVANMSDYKLKPIQNYNYYEEFDCCKLYDNADIFYEVSISATYSKKKKLIEIKIWDPLIYRNNTFIINDIFRL